MTLAPQEQQHESREQLIGRNAQVGDPTVEYKSPSHTRPAPRRLRNSVEILQVSVLLMYAAC